MWLMLIGCADIVGVGTTGASSTHGLITNLSVSIVPFGNAIIHYCFPVSTSNIKVAIKRTTVLKIFANRRIAMRILVMWTSVAGILHQNLRVFKIIAKMVGER